MRTFETILIALGMSQEIFARVICESATYAKVDRKKLGIYSLAFAIWEFGALAIGYYSVELVEYLGIVQPGSKTLHLVAVLIILSQAINMIRRGIKNEIVLERRRDNISLAELMKANLYFGFRTYLIGIAFDACNSSLGIELFSLIVAALLAAISALYIGYRYGYSFKNKAYFIGSFLLISTDILMSARFFF